MNKCKMCNEEMVGEGDECSDCAMPTLKEAFDIASNKAEEEYLKMFGVKVDFNCILKKLILGSEKSLKKSLTAE